MAQILEVVQIIEAISRIPKAFKVTFFSVTDRWIYQAKMSLGPCEECEAYDGLTYTGNRLRGVFGVWLEILDVNTMHPHVHPNCRCRLRRAGSEGDTEE